MTEARDAGHYVRAARVRNGWTQNQAADRAGISQELLSQIENGRRRLTEGSAYKIERGWKLRPYELARWTEKATVPPDASSIDSPGWMCLPPLTAITQAVSRTLVPFSPRPLAHPA